MNCKKLLPFLFLVFFGISVYAQTLSGVYKNDGHATGSYYTVVNWQISYSFEEDAGLVYIKFYNPKITVPSYSKYNFYGQIYSLSDIGLSSWPQQNQRPYAMQVSVNVSDGYKNYDISSSCNGDGSCSRVYIASKNNIKNYSFGNMKIPSGASGFRINLGGEPKTEELLKNRKATDKSQQNSTAQTKDDRNTPMERTSVYTSANQVAKAYNGPTKTEIYTQAATTILGSIVNEVNANYDKKMARWEEESRARTWELIERETSKRRAQFTEQYLPLLKDAEKKDEKTRMLLYIASDILESKDIVPQRDVWYNEALSNNNTDALLIKAKDVAGKYGSNFEKALGYLENIGNLGSDDAFLILGMYHDSHRHGNQSNLAIHYFKRAAELGSPNAMYFLGMIYRYGWTEDNRIRRKFYKKYDVVLDERIALKWFENAYNSKHKESLYSEWYGRGPRYYDASSFNNNKSSQELYKLYNNSKLVKNKEKAKELKIKYGKDWY